ncbi:MAG TPA: sigma 54-interacting transcriptional regulator, partial [Myxococcota bacterium]
PFVGLNCAALTETLLESELFGHERGAFSGAVNTKPGLFEVADKGTVFLDEVGEMSPAIQAKLLRVLEERQVLRVGGLSPRSIDVRFLAASHKDLESEVTAGRFRQDLYFRLNGITVEIPPLRERPAELENLCTLFITDACRRNRRSEVPTVSREAMQLLSRYAWPGNIRELRNIMERAVLLCTDGRITAEHLPVERLQRQRVLPTTAPTVPPYPSPSPYAPQPSSSWPQPPHHQHPPQQQPRPPQRDPWGRIDDDDDDDARTRPAVRRVERERADARARESGRAAWDQGGVDDDMPTLSPGSRHSQTQDSLKEAVSDLERQRIIDALRTCGGNQTKAAEMLGISRRTLVNRLDQYDLPRPRK